MIDARDYLMNVGNLKGLMNDLAGRPTAGTRLRPSPRGAGHLSDSQRAPNVVLTCHTLQEWWQFIKGKYPTYKERTEFLQTEFAPLLASLEQNLVPTSTPRPSAPPRPDVVLVTVNEHETKAVHNAFSAANGTEAKPVALGGRSYHDLGKIGETTVYHAISEMGSGGSGAMQQTVEKAISHLEPGAVIAVGIAFGVSEKDQQIGDVLVSKLLWLYEQQRVGKKGKITARGATPDASPRLMSHFRSFQQIKWAGAKVRFGVVLSGEKLIDNIDFRDSLVKLELEAIGGEMEGAGLYVSSYDRKVDWIVIKAICDWADGNKGVEKEERQNLAAKNAAEFVVNSLKYAPLPHPNGGGILPPLEGPSQDTVPGAAGLLNLAQQVATDSNSLSDEVVERVTGEFIPAQRDRLRRVRVLDLGRPIDLASGYVEVNVAPFRGAVISPEDIRPQIEKGVHPSEIERLQGGERQLVSLSKAVESVRLAVLVGDPGAGKSTQLRHLCLKPNPTEHGLVPVFVAVRDLSAYDGDLIRAVGALLYRATTEPSEARRLTQAVAQGGRLLLCLDGLDELDEANPAEARSMLRRIRVQIDELLAAHQDNRVVVSVRRESMATCQPELPADYQTHEVLSLTDGQIRDLIKKWFSAVDPGQGDALLRACEEAGWPGYISNPLLVVLTCIVFERRNRLPDRPSELYRRCLDVLLEEWDATRRLSRHEMVAGFTTERKLDLLAETALDFHTQRRCCHHRSDVVEIVARHLPKVGMDPAAASAAVGEIASQHGLLRSWSIEGHLALPHLCFQEYLAAKALRDRPNGDELLIERVGDAYWHEVIRLYASQGDTAPLVERLVSGIESFLRQRLFMAASCLSRGAKVSRPELRSRVISALDELAKGPVVYLKKKAIDALAGLETTEANDVLRSHFRNEDGSLDFESYASRYAIRIDGDGAMREMTE